MSATKPQIPTIAVQRSATTQGLRLRGAASFAPDFLPAPDAFRGRPDGSADRSPFLRPEAADFGSGFRAMPYLEGLRDSVKVSPLG